MAAVIPTTFGCCQLIVELGDGQPNIAIDRYVIEALLHESLTRRLVLNDVGFQSSTLYD